MHSNPNVINSCPFSFYFMFPSVFHQYYCNVPHFVMSSSQVSIGITTKDSEK